MQFNKYFLALFALILGFTAGYILKPSKKESYLESKNSKSFEKKEQNIQYKTQINTKTINVLPSFIENELKRFDIDSKDLNQEKWNEFISKLEKNNLDQLEKLSDHGSLIHLAAQKNSKELIKKLLNFGYDINEKDKNGMSPLLHAINKDTQLDYIKFLVKNGANLQINKNDKNSYDALAAALGRGKNNKDDTNEALVDYLLENGFTLNKKYSNIIFSNNSSNKEYYLKNFIDNLEVNEIANENRSTTYFSEMLRHKNISNDMFTYILDNKIDLKNYENKEELFVNDLWRSNISTENIKRIINETKVDINARDKYGNNALVDAIFAGNLEKIEFLLQNNIEITNINDKNKTAFELINNNYFLKKRKDKEELLKLFEKYSKKDKN